MTEIAMAAVTEGSAVQSGDAGSEGCAEKADNVSELACLPVPLPATSVPPEPLLSDSAVLSTSPSSASAVDPDLAKSLVPRPRSPPRAVVRSFFARPWALLNLPSPFAISGFSDRKVLSVTGGKHVLRLPNGMIMKRGIAVKEGEAKAMALVSAQGLPVPELLGFYNYTDYGYLFMKVVDGVTFHEAWPGLTPLQRSSLLSSISSAVSRLHTISRDFIGSPDGVAPTTFGVFETRTSSLSSPRELLEHLQREFVQRGQRLKGFDFSTPSPAFLSLFDDPSFIEQTSFSLQHCDLAPRNILVDPVSGELKAIIDWEDAAFLSVGFEYAALRLESWRPVPGAKELCEALMALATEEEERIGEILWDEIVTFTEAVWWVDEGPGRDV